MTDLETQIKRKIRNLRKKADDTQPTERGNLKYRVYHETANELSDLIQANDGE